MAEIRLTLEEQRAIVTAADKWAWPHDEFAGDLFAAVEGILARRLMAVGELAQEPMWGWPMLQTYWRKMSEIRWATGTETPTACAQPRRRTSPARPPRRCGGGWG
jgi:hypothetical protein